jgi:5-methylcytosine-specific restriction endonuclease McrA
MTSFPLRESPKPVFKRIKPTAAQRGLINQSTRKRLLERSQGLCERCGKGGQPLEAAHLIRRWRIEGKTTINELAHLCQPCHFHCDNTSAGRHWLTEFRSKLLAMGLS